MTIRIPKFALIALAAVAVAGIAVAVVLLVGSSDEGPSCVSPETGAELDCEAEGAIDPDEYVAQQQAKAEEEAARAAAERKAAKCTDQLGELMDALQELDSRLSVGLNYDEYTRQVGNVRVTYDRVPFGQLSADCITNVGLPLENAMNSYAKAANTWGDCIGDLGCDTDSIDPELQKRWSTAGSQVQSAQSGLRSMGRA